MLAPLRAFSTHTQEEFTKLAQDPDLGPNFEVKYEVEEPWGTYQNLSSERKYHCWVVQDPKEEEKERAKMKDKWEEMDKRNAELAEQAEQKHIEGCSCVDGMPCMDPYVCLDWHNRVKVATENGFNPAANKIWKM